MGYCLFQHGYAKLKICQWSHCKSDTLDQIVINRKLRISLPDFKVHRGTDINSDHYLLITKMKLKLRAKYVIQQRRKVFDIKFMNCIGALDS